jgi:hypothetical protein
VTQCITQLRKSAEQSLGDTSTTWSEVEGREKGTKTLSQHNDLGFVCGRDCRLDYKVAVRVEQKSAKSLGRLGGCIVTVVGVTTRSRAPNTAAFSGHSPTAAELVKDGTTFIITGSKKGLFHHI